MMILRASTRKGFTIVELLIVIVVIATLAAITVTSYNGVAERSKVAALKADSATIERKVQLKGVEAGAIIPPQGAVTDKESFLQYYSLNALGDRIVYSGGEGLGDRDKIHVRAISAMVLTSCSPETVEYRADPSYIEWSYWDESQGIWVQNTKFGNKERALSTYEFHYAPNPDSYFSTIEYMGAVCPE